MNSEREAVAEALGAYDIGGELGRGANGLVFAGRHQQLARDVAIKALPRVFGLDPEVRKRFIAEAQLLAALDHPHIVPVYDFVDAGGLCLLVMERLTGGTVGSRLARGEITPPQACAIVLAACAGLDHAHRRGVLHRDIKPDNLMFSRDGLLKVTDFGIAKVIGGTLTMGTRAGYVVGTPAYIAPEQAQGGELTPATDVYGIGTVLFELLSGRLPYPEDGDPVVALYRHVHEDPLKLIDVAPHLPGDFEPVVQMALARHPDDRIPTAEGLGKAIAATARDVWGPGWIDSTGMPMHVGALVEPGAGAPPSTGGARAPVTVLAAPGPVRSSRRKVALIGIGAIVLAGGIVGGVLATRSGGGSSHRPPVTAALPPAASFDIVPSSGRIGTTITVRSKTPCPPAPAGWKEADAYAVLYDPRAVGPGNDGVIAGKQYAWQPDRSWAGELDVPAGASPGPDRIRSYCGGIDPNGNLNPYFDYPSGVPFTVQP